MPTPESALRRLEEDLDDLQRQFVAIAFGNDGMMDEREKRIDEGLTHVRGELLNGDAMINHAVSILRTWERNGSPRSQRRLREVARDLVKLPHRAA